MEWVNFSKFKSRDQFYTLLENVNKVPTKPSKRNEWKVHYTISSSFFLPKMQDAQRYTRNESINISRGSKSAKIPKENQDAKIHICMVKDQFSTNCEPLQKQMQIQNQLLAGNMTENLAIMSNIMQLKTNAHAKRTIFKYRK